MAYYIWYTENNNNNKKKKRRVERRLGCCIIQLNVTNYNNNHNTRETHVLLKILMIYTDILLSFFK